MNRRRGERRFQLPSLQSLRGVLAKVRLPTLSRKNRRKGSLFAKRAEAESTTTARSPGAANATSEAAPTRSRPWQWVLAFLAFAAPLAAAVVAFVMPLLGVRAYDYVMESGYFNVREVLVDHVTRPGDKPLTPHLSREELLALAGIDAGTQVIDADIDRMTEQLVASPWVRWAKIDRELPDKLVLHVVEHRPSAFLAADELYLIDELGEPFAVAPADFAERLPVISGIAQERLDDAKASPAIARELQSALNVLQIWASQGLSRRYPVGELRIQGGGSLALVLEGKTVGAATEIVLGRAPFREKLFRVEWVLEHLRSIGKTADYILLDLADDAREGYASAVDIGGARVVVKTELGAEIADSGRRPAPLAKPEANPDGGDVAPVPSPQSNRPQNPASGSDAPSANSRNPNTPATEPADDPLDTEMVPVTGGRPAPVEDEE